MDSLVRAGFIIGGIAFALAIAHELGKSEKPPQITMMAAKSAEVPADLRLLLAPDLNHVRVWGEKSLAKN